MPPEYTGLELVAVDVSDSMCMPFRLVVAYRWPSPSGSDNALLFSALSYLANNCARFCMMGDLNLPDFNWDLFIYPDNELYNSVSDFICNNGLTQLVDQPTRSDNILDYVFSSDSLCCDNLSYLPPLASSDHCIVTFSLALSFLDIGDNIAEVSVKLRPNLSKANWPALREYLESVNWFDELGSCN